jgi:hydroxymethylpyrimidine/phosphomethylpyrimidine kinase
MVRAQIRSVARDLHPSACKTGMLATRDIVTAVADAIVEEGLENYVLDPVMVATSGDRLLDRDAEQSVNDRLLPLCTLITPNLDEARILTGMPIADAAGMQPAAERLVRMGARAALIKGGHLEGDTVIDLLFDGTRVRTWQRQRIDTRSTHGTGCTLSAAITAGLSLGRPLADSVEDALDYVHRAIAAAPGLGAGNGPLDHFVVPRKR